MRFWLIIFLPILSLAQTTHHITPSTSLTTVNAYTLSPGDSLLFQRGGTWKGSLDLDNKHGSFLQNIIVTADTGTGALPIITARDTVTGWSSTANWVQVLTNVWRFIPATGNLGYDNPHFYAKRLWLADVSHPEGVEYPFALDSSKITSRYRYSWLADYTGNFWVYSVGNPATYYTKMEQPGTVDGAITMYGSTYFKIQNMELRGAEGGCIDIAAGANKIDIRGCTIGRDTGHDGIRLFGRNDSINIVGNRIIDGDTAKQYMYEAVYISNGIGVYTGAHNIRIDSNLIADWFHSCVDVSDIYSITGVDTVKIKNGYTISNISIKYNKMTGTNSSYCRGTGLDAYGTHKPYKVFFGYNQIDSMTARSQMELDSGVFVYNVISNHRNHGLLYGFVDNSGQGFMATGYNGTVPQNMNVSNNTFYNCEEAGIAAESSTAYTPTRHNLFANNLIYNCGTVGQGGVTGYQFVIQILTGSSVDSNEFHNNLIFGAGVAKPFYDNQRAGGVQALTAANWNLANGYMGNTIGGNIDDNPQLVSATDLSLQVGSPAGGTGFMYGSTYTQGIVPGSSWPDHVTLGAQPTLWNIGAYVGSVAPPPIGTIRIPRKIYIH